MKRELESDNSAKSNEKKVKKKAKLIEETISDFDVKSFRKNLKSGNFNDELRYFINNSSDSPHIISDFLECGGRPLEIVEAIKNNNKNIEVLSNLFQMLLQVISNEDVYTQKVDADTQALKFLVSKNKESVVKVLSSSEPLNKITILKILTIAVLINRDIGIDILKSIELFAKSNEKADLSILQDTSKNKKKSDESVRLAFVKFFMSYLCNESDVILCKRILQKRALFEFLMKDLWQDSFQTIKFVLNTLTKSVLASSGFNKAEKLRIFTEDVVKYLLKIYEWKVNESDKDDVVSITHHFLLLLLTNKKHGIVFKAFTERNRNLRQVEVIGFFKNVWMHEFPSKLVIEILKACPDLMQIILDRLVMGLQPRLTAQWFMCANFTKELMIALDPALVANFLSSLQAKKISSNIIKLSISHYILQNVNENALIQQESLEICEVSTSLLHLMLNNCCKYLEEIKKIATLKDYEQHRIKFDIINHIFTFFPHIDIILNSLYRSINLSVRKKSNDYEKLVKSQLIHTLDILILLIDKFPSIIEKIPSVIDYLNALRPIYEFKLNTEDVENNEDLEIEMKVVKIILALQPDIISTQTQEFKRIFLVMIQVYCCSHNESYRTEAQSLLYGIMQNTGIFSSNDSLEISIWLESLRQINKGLMKDSTMIFIDVLKSIKSTENVCLKDDKEMIWDRSILKLIDSSDINSNVVQYNGLSMTLKKLLEMPASKLSKAIDFVELSFLLLYHSYPDQKETFVNLLSDTEVNTNLIEYLETKSLNDFGQFILPAYFDFICRKLQTSIISDEKVVIKASREKECLLLILQIIFCAVKLSQENSLTDAKIDLLIAYTQELFSKIQEYKNEPNINEATNELNESNTKAVNKIFTINIQSTSDVLISHIFEHNNEILKEFDITDSSNQMTNFIIKLITMFKSNRNFETSVMKFRLKLISQIRESKKIDNDNILNAIEIFQFSSNEYVQILETVLEKKASSTQLRLIMLILKKLTEMQAPLLSPQHVSKIEKIYIATVKTQKCEFLSEFEDALENYLSTFPHNIINTTTKIFELTLQDELTISRSFVKLACTIFNYNDKWNEFFTSNGLKLRKEILFPLINIAHQKEIISDSMFSALYQEFKSGIIRAIEKPKRAAQIYRENVKSSIILIQHAMPTNESRDLSMKKFKFESTDIFQLEMLSAICIKAVEKEAENKNAIFLNFLNHWLQMLKLMETKNMYQEYTKVLAHWLTLAPSEIDYEKLHEGNFENFYEKCLKYGLKSNDNSNLLVILGRIICTLNVDPDKIAVIFDMILTHSNFFSLAFNMKSSAIKWKRDLFFLINILIQKNPRIADKKHVPIYLSSYQATMSSSDQLILNLLRFYELQCEIDLFEFRPFLFGSSALSHFTSMDEGELKISIKSVDDINTAFYKLINSFEKSIVDNTVKNYPIKRKLAGINLQELNQFINDAENEQNVYDPAYFLPLFELFLSTNTFNFVSIAITKKLMQLIPPALSCEDESVRLMAAHILMKCRENTEGKKEKRTTKDIWIRFYDLIQKGLVDVKEGTGNQKVKKFPRISSISSQLIAEFFNIVPDKLHNVHQIVSNYLVVREKFEFATIPEFMVLFCSYDVQQENHRMFLLNTINNGIKDNLDFKILNQTPMIKMILASYGCGITNRNIDLLILKIIDNLITKSGQSKFLIERYGLALWIYQAAVNVEAFEYDLIDMIILLMEHLHVNVKDDAETCKISMSSLMMLLPKFTKTRLTLEIFLKFISTVNILQQNNPTSISSKSYDLILEIANIFIPIELKQYLVYINQYPLAIKDVNSCECPNLSAISDEITKELINQCRKFIKNFHSNKN